MPELPEVELSRRQLTRWCAGEVLRGVEILDHAVVRSELSSRPSLASAEKADRIRALVGRRAREPVRHGKRLGWSFGEDGLVAHYGMSGHWIRTDADGDRPHLARLGLRFPKATAWYVDGRRFGCVVPVSDADLAVVLRGNCGPDALDTPLAAPALRGRVACRKVIKVALMEQDRIAGLGNIHAAEACFRAGVSPHAPANGLDDAAWERLSASILAQLRETIDTEADTDELRYVNLGGPNPFAVYDREDEPCPRCATPVRAAEQAGRTTFWCPTCQPGP